MHPIRRRHLRLSGFEPGINIAISKDHQTGITGVDFKRYRHKDRYIPEER